MAAHLEEKLLQRRLHIHISSRLASLVQPLQNGIGTIYVSGMMLVVVQTQLSLRDVRRESVVGVGQFG